MFAAHQSPQTAIPRCAGIGLRHPHLFQVLRESPRLAWFEVHSENYFAKGGAHIDALQKIRERYPLSLHGVGLSLGSTDCLNVEHLNHLRRAIARFTPGLVSEHLSWSSYDGRFANDLLPLPYTEEALRHVSRNIERTQDALGRQILVENVSSYLRFRDCPMTEWDFIAGVVAESGCGLLLDINNVYVASRNHNFDAGRYLQAIPDGSVQEFHLAGHSTVEVDGCRLHIDTHSNPVCDAVWELYAEGVLRFGDLPTVIEWDAEIPSFDVLQAEADRADRQRSSVHAVAA